MQFLRTDIRSGSVRNCTIWGVERRMKTIYFWSSISNIFEKMFWLLYFSLLKMLVNAVTVFFRSFAKLRKSKSSFDMSICLSVLPSFHSSICPHGTSRLPVDGFSWNVIFEDFSKILKKIIEVSLKFYKDNGYFTWMYIFFIIYLRILLRIRNVADKTCRDNKNAHLVLDNSVPKIAPFVS